MSRIRFPMPLDWRTLHNLMPIINTALIILESEGISGGLSIRPSAIPSREDDVVLNDFVSASSMRLWMVSSNSTQTGSKLETLILASIHLDLHLISWETCLGLLLGGLDLPSFLLFFNPSLSLRPVEGWTKTSDALPDDIVDGVSGSSDFLAFFLLKIPADGIGASPEGPGVRIVSVTYLA